MPSAERPAGYAQAERSGRARRERLGGTGGVTEKRPAGRRAADAKQPGGSLTSAMPSTERPAGYAQAEQSGERCESASAEPAA